VYVVRYPLSCDPPPCPTGYWSLVPGGRAAEILILMWADRQSITQCRDVYIVSVDRIDLRLTSHMETCHSLLRWLGLIIHLM